MYVLSVKVLVFPSRVILGLEHTLILEKRGTRLKSVKSLIIVDEVKEPYLVLLL